MRQGPKPAKSEEAKPPVGRKSPKDDSGKVREVEERLEEALRGKAEAQEQLRTRDRELVEAQGQQTATGEVLRIISGSPTDLQPVFDAIAASALRLCGGVHSGVWLYDGELIHLAALENVTPKGGESIRRDYPRPADMSSGTGRTVLTRAVVQIADVLQDPAYGLMGEARAVGFRSFLSAPMLQSGKLVGIVGVSRSEAGPFPDKLVQLLQTFADQAVIAIENVQLFTELQEKNRALTQAHAQVTESLEQQTATADILQVISRSPTDVQPVFDTIVTSARALTGAQACGVFLLHSDIVSIAAHDSLSDEWRQEYPRVVSANTVTGRAMLERTTVHVKDLEKNPDYEGAPGRRVGIRTVLAVPMLREGQTIGAIAVWRTEVKSFSDKQIALLQTFVDQAIIAIENVRLFKELEARNRELTTTLDRQTTTADVLRIIAQSQTDLQPVLDAIAASAVRLCAASDAVIERLEGDRFYNAAHAGTQMTGLVGLPLPLTRRFPGGRAVLDRTPIIIDDIQLVAESEYPDTLELLRLNTIHSVAEIPLLSEGKPLGSLAVLRAEMRPFTDAEVALLQTFADQAVIAIENVRLFTELQQKNEALTQANAQVTEALDQQTATSEILRVIASSPTDVQPVFDTIAERAMRLCGADQGWVFSFDGELIHVKSLANVSEEGTDAVRQAYPVAPSRGMVTGRAILTGDVVHIPDVRDDPEYSLKAVAETASYRGLLGVPMLHRGRPIGVISVPRTGPGPFSERQIEVLKTFADQAVIAIENVRLFTELQTSNRELTTALDTQTATADILRVISQSQTDVQPVFDAILASAVRLLGAYSGVLTRIAADQIVLAALTSTDDAGDAATRALFPQALQSELSKTGQWDKMAAGYAEVIRERAPLNIADVHTDPRWPETARAYARLRGYRSWAAVPMILRDEAIGTISVTRSEAGGFTDDEIALLKTFADQAVIAIENVRLFKELEARTQDLTRSVDELTALGEVGRAVSSTLDLETVLSTIVSRAIQLSGTDGGSVYEYDEATEEFSLRASRDLPEAYVEQVQDARPRKGEGAVGRVAQTREPVQIADISDPAAYESRVRNTLLQIGLRALLAVPLIAEDQLVGALIVMRKRAGTFAAEEVALLQTFATQSALAIQNARLFREIADKSRQLEVASQHKSEFLANMSHELRTPLNAIIGFSEVLTDRMFGELNEKQEEYLKDIYASGTHLLSLINDILDLSKIEAGRMELELTDFDIPTALDNAIVLVRERAARHGISLHKSIDERLGQIQADERKVRQVVLNLLSNAIKFTPEGGRIEVLAAPKDGAVEVSVSDTGVGIAPEDQETVFEEFRQVGTAAKKVEGTGLGLTLCRKFVELHGGRIWVKSEVGVGSTFTFSLPLRSA